MALIPRKSKRRDVEEPQSTALASLRSEFDRLLDSFIREPFGLQDWPGRQGGAWVPSIDIAESDKEVTVRAELPGIDPKDLSITLSGNQLILSGEKKESTEKKSRDFYHVESRYGSFRRVVPLPDEVKPENVDARYSDGVLTIRLEKSASVPPKRIEVKVRR